MEKGSNIQNFEYELNFVPSLLWRLGGLSGTIILRSRQDRTMYAGGLPY